MLLFNKASCCQYKVTHNNKPFIFWLPQPFCGKLRNFKNHSTYVNIQYCVSVYIIIWIRFLLSFPLLRISFLIYLPLCVTDRANMPRNMIENSMFEEEPDVVDLAKDSPAFPVCSFDLTPCMLYMRSFQ